MSKQNLFLRERNGYSSHQDVLHKMLSLCSGKVIELGVGAGSTYIFSWYAMHILKEGYVLSLETDSEWLEKSKLISKNHAYELVDNYTKYHWNVGYLEDTWELAFVDNAPGESRQSNILKLANKAKWIVVHDTEEAGYGYDFSGFKYVKTFKEHRPWTTVLSNFEEIPI